MIELSTQLPCDTATINAMSVDVEDYFQVSAFENSIDRVNWDLLECRIESNCSRILELFDIYQIKSTFFVLGWVAERYPLLISEIVDAGHELASHGYGHQRATTQTKAEFRQDIRRAKSILEDISGQAIKGYRAPSYSIGQNNLWALDELVEAGYQYSSSIYPVQHDLYGIPNAPRFPFLCSNGLLEIPITTVRIGNRNLPFGGGGFFRLYPYTLSRWGISRVNHKDHQPSVFYFHPWEIDPEQPRVEGIPFKSRFRHYLNLHRTESRLKRLLSDFSWGRMDDIYLHAQPKPDYLEIAALG